MTDFFAPDGPLARHLDRFEARGGQRLMAEAVTEVIASSEPQPSGPSARLLIVEAETGIGKTLAYLVPAILSGARVVVSTATLNLQDQIMQKEVPLIESILGRSVPVVCIKGRQNYLCLYRWYQYQSGGGLPHDDEEMVARIGQWLEHTESGDRADLEWLPERSTLWPKISAQSSQCLGGDCPEAASCFITRLRKLAGGAALLVVNHHLFFSDLALRQSGFAEVLPRYEGVVFDEAHHLENVVSAFFGKTFSQYQLIDLIADIERQGEIDLDPDRYDKIVGAARGLKQRVEEFSSLFPLQTGRYYLEAFIEQYGRGNWQAEVDLLAVGIRRLAADLGDCSGYSEGWRTLERRAGELADSLEAIACPDEHGRPAPFIHWYERRERSLILSATPINVSELLETTLYSSVDWCILTSATLSSGGDFSYLQQRLGLGHHARFLRLPSPFDYRGRALLYVPQTGFPEPADPRYQEQAAGLTAEILASSRGRGLVLCTSLRAMESMADYLERHLDYPILVQGRGSRSSLLTRFREDSSSVLVAVASFWEGVDVKGEALSCVIIDKLPFEVPSDPVVQARIQAVTEQGGNGFFDFQVPRAILTLRQGVGRLMRSADDRGVIAILDIRLFSKRYGRRFLASLPPAPVVRDLRQVAEFFAATGN